ncbi:LysR family transcriptional regulator [Sulfoacidibacillus thermotolerans]|nr:LysR family transcriptional regulator [Sulfoacidibacillus thermotolerans]
MRWIEYALEVYRQASFTRAAEAMCVAQPSLSQQVAKLERELGVVLFERGHSAVTPTEAGRRFIHYAEEILRLRDDLAREMHERGQGMGKELVLGAPAITGGHVLPPVLHAFTSRFPQVRVRFIEETTEALEELAVSGVTDLTLLSLPLRDERLAVHALFTEPLYLAVPQELAPKECKGFREEAQLRVKLSDFASRPFILLKQGYGFRDTVLALCAEAGFQPLIAYETSSIETAQALVANGLGVTVVPAMVRRVGSPKPAYLLLDSEPTRTLVFAYRKDRYLSLVARAFLEVFEDVRVIERPF